MVGWINLKSKFGRHARTKVGLVEHVKRDHYDKFTIQGSKKDQNGIEIPARA